MKANKLVLPIAVILLVLVLAYAVKTGYVSVGGVDTLSSNPQQNKALAETLGIGQQATDFKLTTLDNQEFKLTDKKDKTVIVFGVAGWCGECIPEGKALTQVKKDYAGKGVEIIGVAFTKGDNDEFLKQYKQVGGIDIPLALDTDNVAGKYQIKQLETTYIINKEGVIVYKDEGFTSYDDYKKELDKII